MTDDHPARAAPVLAASASQPDPAAHAAWIARIRELRLAGRTLDEARVITGPMPGTAARRAEANRKHVRTLLAERQPAFAAVLTAVARQIEEETRAR